MLHTLIWGPAEYFYVQLLLHFYHINLQHSSCKSGFSIRVENSVGPDQMASEEACQSGYTEFSERLVRAQQDNG